MKAEYNKRMHERYRLRSLEAGVDSQVKLDQSLLCCA